VKKQATDDQLKYLTYWIPKPFDGYKKDQEIAMGGSVALALSLWMERSPSPSRSNDDSVERNREASRLSFCRFHDASTNEMSG
jgi:hypothetical protein